MTTYTYDVFGNLKRVDLPNNDFIEYIVDGQSRRVAKKKNGVVVTRWLYRDQLHPVAELNADGTIAKRFVYASGKNSPDYMIQGSSTYRIFSDELGSPRVMVDAASGAVVARMRHDEFGAVLEDTVSARMPFGFAGGLYDLDTGLVRFGARDYDPVVGRWISKDPILFGGRQANLYVYVGNDPVNAGDSSGLYGTDSCDYYESRCNESGGDYYCNTAQHYCGHVFPKSDDPDPSRDDDFEGWTRCTRQCLQDCDAITNADPEQNSCFEDSNTNGFWDYGNLACHTTCYVGCASQPYWAW